MRLHEYERNMQPKQRIRFLEWKHHHRSAIYKLKEKTILIEPCYRKLSLKEKIDLKKNPQEETIIMQAIKQEQLEFESQIIALHKITTNNRQSQGETDEYNR